MRGGWEKKAACVSAAELNSRWCVSDPLARFARVAEGGRGALTRHLELECFHPTAVDHGVVKMMNILRLAIIPSDARSAPNRSGRT